MSARAQKKKSKAISKTSVFPTLYKKDTTDKIRQWSIIAEDNKFWTAQGILDGKIIVNKPTITHPKNIGKSNETSAEEQAHAEAKAKWEIKKS